MKNFIAAFLLVLAMHAPNSASAQIYVSGDNCALPATLSFGSYTGPLVPPVTYFWYFYGIGATSTSSNPVMTYTSPGDYAVYCEMYDLAGNVDTNTTIVHILGGCAGVTNLAGRLYNDIDEDCSFNAGDAAYANGQVHIQSIGGTIDYVANVSSGFYHAYLMADTTFTITPVPGSAAWIPGCPDTAVVITPMSGANDTLNFALDSASKVFGQVYFDYNGNCTPDLGEDGVAGAVVHFQSASGNGYDYPVGANGNYTLFLPGNTTYTISVGLMGAAAGYCLSIPDTSFFLPEEAYLNINAGATDITTANFQGTSYLDADNDCAYNPGSDLAVANVPIHIISQGGALDFYTFTAATGQYTINLPADTLFQFNVIAPANLAPHCPTDGDTILSGLTGGTVTQDFGFTCDTPAVDVLLHVNVFSAGVSVCAYNTGGCTDTIFTLALTIPPGMAYAATPGGYAPPDTAIGDQLIWHLGPFGNFCTQILWTPDTAIIHLGDMVCWQASITPLPGEANLANNVAQNCHPYTGPYDPNNKLVLPTGTGPQGYIPDSAITLTYLINFQNTGTAEATAVVLRDTLSAHVDPASIKLIGASHPVSMAQDGNALAFSFPGIHLPDSNANEPGSHGHVIYSVKANPTLGPGTAIQNTASIYFDANAPVVTNTTLNTIAQAPDTVTAVAAMATGAAIAIHPNPTRGEFSITLPPDYADWSVTITDTRGAIIQQLAAPAAQMMPVKLQAAPGLYFVRLHNSRTGETGTRKLLIAP